MKVTIYTADGESLTIGDMPADAVESLVGVLDSPDWDALPFLTFTLDDVAVSRVRRDQVTRIDIE
jgi:hypothetical protein